MNWYTKELGDVVFVEEALLERLRAALIQARAQAGDPPSMAIFKRLESEGRLHCGLVLYFSPDAGQVAESVEGEPCEKPARAGLELLAGDERAWRVWFPESG